MNNFKVFIALCITLMCITSAVCEPVTCLESADSMNGECTIQMDYLEPDFSVFEIDTLYYSNVITKLKFTNSHLVYTPSEVFAELEKLKSLDFSKSQVEFISSQTFIFGYNLQILNLTNNRITQVPDSVFSGADNLVEIDLSYNKISEIGVKAFINLRKLTKIDLSHNAIKTLIGEMFPLNIVELGLSFNQIVKFDISDLSQNIDSINLSNNKLEILKLNQNVKTLQVDNNLLSENLNFNNNSRLSYLSLRNNSLSNLNFIKTLSCSLSYLDVSHNPIKNGLNENKLFANLRNLKILILKSVNFGDFNFQDFSDIRYLQVLDISYNNLAFIDLNSLAYLENLEELYLNNNNLTGLVLSGFDYLLPNLKLIDISENNWQCDDLKKTLTKFQYLNIKNHIDDDKLITADLNIRGIRCSNDINNKNDVTNLEPSKSDKLATSNTFDNDYLKFNQKLNDIQTRHHNIETKLTDVSEKLNSMSINVVDDVKYRVNDLNVQNDQRKQEFKEIENLLVNRNDNYVALTQRIDDLEYKLSIRIDYSGIQFDNLKLFLLIGLGVICCIGISITVWKRFPGKNKQLYNNYNFPTIVCSEGEPVEKPVAKSELKTKLISDF